jgi:hypothetical protein
MDTNGARYTTGFLDPQGPRNLDRCMETPPPAPIHDLLVMSHSPDAQPGERSNHACLNSFTSSSWIMAAGG